MIGMIRTVAWLASLFFVMLCTKLVTLYLPLCQLSVIRHILTNHLLHCWVGGFEISKKSLQTVFSRLAFFPTRPYHPVSPFSLHGDGHLRSRWLNARPSDPKRKKTGYQQTNDIPLWRFLLVRFIVFFNTADWDFLMLDRVVKAEQPFCRLFNIKLSVFVVHLPIVRRYKFL